MQLLKRQPDEAFLDKFCIEGAMQNPASKVHFGPSVMRREIFDKIFWSRVLMTKESLEDLENKVLPYSRRSGQDPYGKPWQTAYCALFP